MYQEDGSNEDEVRGGCISRRRIDDVYLRIVLESICFSLFFPCCVIRFASQDIFK